MAIDPAKSIPEFYAGQSIFLTGATGFLGKVFIEKVLRSCPDVREIFLLIRPKKGLNVNQRLEKILNLPLFEKLREKQPSTFDKLIPISGDILEEGLGLSATDRQMLIDRVTIIIHGAASVKFNDSLKRAIFANTRATRDICILGQSMKNLIVLLHVSTAYVNVNKPFIEEKVDPIADWRKMIEVAETLDEHSLNIFTAKCLDYASNTYFFSKNLGESVIEYYSSFLPCGIVRSSMVMSTLKEPFPGWIDNIYGPIGYLIGIAKGIAHVAYVNMDAQINEVPVDIVIKAMLVVSWKLGLTNFTTGSTPFVLNCVNEKRISNDFNHQIFLSTENEIPVEGKVWTSSATITDNYVLFYILTMLLHVLPAILIDKVLKLSGRQPMVLQQLRRLYVLNCYTSHFMVHTWKFSNANSLALMSSIPPDDLDMFSFDYSYDDRKEYLKNCVIGAKKFLLHEDMNRLDKAIAHRNRLHLFVAAVKIITFIGLLWIICM